MKRLTLEDWEEVERLGTEFASSHGHSDERGIINNRLDGYSWGDIRTLPCHECPKSRGVKRVWSM